MSNIKIHDKTHKSIARSLRSDMTEQERKLWYHCLRDTPVNFRRQVTIGNYIVDFYCPKLKLVIELDGSQHYEDKGLEYDAKRDEYLRNLGMTVLRFSNEEINNSFTAVCDLLYSYFK